MVSAANDPMRSIWEAIAQKSPDGKRYIQWRDRRDIEYLYETGFVDTDKFSMKEWMDSFQDSLQPNASYRVTEDQWFSKRPFRYSGPTHEPFNPLTMREGEWTPEELDDVIDKQFLPSTNLKREHFEKMLQKGREMGRFVNGKYIINKPFKFGLKQLMDTYASPKRRREMAVVEARENLNRQKPVLRPSQPSPAALSHPTAFSTGPSKEKQMTDRLSQLLGKGRK
jgi:hypothetical protein